MALMLRVELLRDIRAASPHHEAPTPTHELTPPRLRPPERVGISLAHPSRGQLFVQDERWRARLGLGEQQQDGARPAAGFVRCQTKRLHAMTRFASVCAAAVWILAATLSLNSLSEPLRAANQTAELTPIRLHGSLPYRIEVEPYDFGEAALPTLHSFAAGVADGKWVILAGRTNGMHGFKSIAANNFPPASQNRSVWVIDPVAKQSWSRSLEDPAAGLTLAELNSLTQANCQSYQRGDRLYMTGGYGVEGEVNGSPYYNTFDKLSAIDLAGLAAWAMGGPGSAKSHIRQTSDPLFKITGGAMYEIGGRTHLAFGQDFVGNYTNPANGEYSNQVRSFDIVDDGATLSIANVTRSTPDSDYRRRDLNIVPVIRPGSDGSLEQALVALSGVFTPTNGAWTVPVEIDAAGNPTMEEPANSDAFKQGFNGYHSAKIGLYSQSARAMHELLCGGISLQTYDAVAQQVVTDDRMPFVNDITSIVIDEQGDYAQHRIGEFPVLNDLAGHRLHFGANAELFLADGIQTYDNGVVMLDALSGPTTLGYIFGGVASNAAHTRNVPGAATAASNVIFRVRLTPIPEPAAATLAATAAIAGAITRRRRMRHSNPSAGFP
jgi:hypothetical protein